MNRIVLTLLFTLTSLCSLNAAAAVQSVDSAVTPDKGRVCDPFTYTVTVHGTGLEKLKIVLPETKSYFPGPADKKKKSPDKSKDDENIPPLYTVKAAELVPGRDADSETLAAKLIIIYMKPGTYTLPEIKITGEDGVPIGYRLQSVTVIETNPEGAFEEIEGPLEPATDYTRMALIAAAAIAVIALSAAAGIYLYRRWKKNKVAGGTVPDLPPYMQFLAELESFNPEECIAQGRIKEYVFGMSIAFRHLLSAQFGFDAAEMTTDEIRSGLKKFMPADLYSAHAADIISSMDFWDISKFAAFTPSAEMMTQNLRETRNIAAKITVTGGDNVEPGV